jgi:hypothetical protein
MTIKSTIGFPPVKPPRQVPFLVKHSTAGCVILVTKEDCDYEPHTYEGVVVAQLRDDGHKVGFVARIFDPKLCEPFDGAITLQNEEK